MSAKKISSSVHLGLHPKSALEGGLEGGKNLGKPSALSHKGMEPRQPKGDGVGTRTSVFGLVSILFTYYCVQGWLHGSILSPA